MYKNIVGSLSVVYVFFILIMFCQFVINVCDKLPNDLEYPEIASLVSWKGDNMSNAESAMSGKDLNIAKQDYDVIRDQETKDQLDSLPSPQDELVSKQKFSNNVESTRNNFGINDAQLWRKSKITKLTDDKPVVINDRPLEGVGPLKFEEQEQNGDTEVNANLIHHFNRLPLSSDEENPSYLYKRPMWNNDYRNINGKKINIKYDIGSESNQGNEINGRQFFSNKNLNKDLNSQNQHSTGENNNDQYSWENGQNENYKVQNSDNINNMNDQNIQKMDDKEIQSLDTNPLRTASITRYRTKINPQEVSVNSLKNKQLEQIKYILDNKPPTNLQSDSLTPQIHTNKHNVKLWNFKNFLHCNGDRNCQNRYNLGNLPADLNANEPSSSVNIQEKMNNENCSNNENVDLSEQKEKYENQKTLNLLKANNEKIVKEALQLTKEDTLSDQQSQTQINDNSVLKLESIDTSQNQMSLDERTNKNSNRPNLSFSGNKVINDDISEYPSVSNSPFYLKSNRLNSPNYQTLQSNNIEVNKKDELFSVMNTADNWADIPKDKNNNMQSNENNDGKIGNFYDQYEKPLQKEDFYQKGSIQTYGLKNEPNAENYFSLNNDDKMKKDESFNKVENVQGETREVVNDNAVFNASNIYMDMHSLPDKRPRKGRNHAGKLATYIKRMKHHGAKRNIFGKLNRNNKASYNSGDMMKMFQVTDRLPTQLYSNSVTIFSVPTPMAMLPAAAVMASTIIPPKSNFTRPSNGVQCPISAAPPLVEPFKKNAYNKIHKAVPSYINVSNKMNGVEEKQINYYTKNINQVTPTVFTNKLLAEAISAINNPADSTGNEFDYGGSITEDPMQKSYQANQEKSMPYISNKNTYDLQTKFQLPNASLDPLQSQQPNDNFKTIANGPNIPGYDKNIFKQPSLIDKQSQLNKSPQQGVDELSKNMTLANKESLSKIGSTGKYSNDLSQINMIKDSHKPMNTINIKKLESDNLKSNNLSSNITNSAINPKGMIKSTGNDESIPEIMPYSQWIDKSYESRNRRGIECGCFPANEEEDRIIDSENDESDYVEENYYAMMNKHNPKAMAARVYNNWVADRENRAQLKKENLTNNSGHKDTRLKGKLNDNQEAEDDEENGNIVGDEVNYYGEEELRPLRLDDPELALVKHQDLPSSRNTQSRGNELGDDEDDDLESVPLITHTPVKYVKWHNLTSGAFGRFSNHRQTG